MCYRDKNCVPVSVGDVVEKDSKKYLVKFIVSYPMATEVITENLKTHQVATLLLRDVKKV